MFDSIGMGRFEVELGADYMQLKRDLDRAKADLGQGFTEMQAMARSLNASLSAIGAGISLGGIMTVGKDLLEVQKRAEALKTALQFASGGRATDELDYLRRKVSDLGLEFQSTAASYAKWQASARGTAIDGRAARDVFEAVGQASAVMGLSVEENQGVLLALGQMISKGTVQSEELRGQLGERLPGAFQIAARAMGVTTSELSDLLEKGLVPASTFLPKFAEQLNRELGDAAEGAADRTSAAVNRMVNAYEMAKELAAEATPFSRGLNFVGAALEEYVASTMRARREGKGFIEEMKEGQLAYLRAAGLISGVGESSALLEVQIRDANAELRRLKEGMQQNPGNIFLQQHVREAQELVNKLREAKAARAELDLVRGSSQSQQFGEASKTIDNLAREGLERQQKAQQALADARNKALGVDGAYIKKLQELHGFLQQGVLTQDEYTEAAQKLTAASFKKSEAAKNEADAYLNLIAASRKRVEEMRAEGLSGERLGEAQRKLLELQSRIEAGTEAYNQALYRRAAAQLQLEAQEERSLQLKQRQAQAEMAAAKANDAEFISLVKSAKALQDQVREQRASNASILSGIDYSGRLASTKLREAANTQELLAIKVEEKNLDFALGEQYRANAKYLRELADAKGATEQLNKIADLRREIDAFFDPAKAQTFGDALRDVFGDAGKGLAGFVGALDDYGRKYAEIQRLKQKNEKEEKDVFTMLFERQALVQQEAELQVEGYARMASAAKGFFEEGSKGYKALEAAEAGFRAYQLASDLVKGISAAKVAIATQAQGEPYSAWARMALMAGAMAALGFAVNSASNGSNGAISAAPKRQEMTGTGTVFGDAEAKSESIAKGIDVISETARLELRYTSEMLDSLRNIENSIGGVANLVLRTPGLTTGSNFGVQTGTLSVNQGDPLAKAVGLGGFDKFLGETSMLFGSVGKALHGLWGKTKQEVSDSGLSILGSMSDLAAGRGVDQYADVTTTSSSWFGLKKKSSTSTLYGDLDAGIAQQFGRIFDSIGDTLVSASGALGRDGAMVSDAIADFVVDIPRLSLKGLKGDELQEAIGAAVGASADMVAKSAFDGLDDFQRVGEGYFETVVRVAAGVEEADYVLESFGLTAVEFTELVRKQGDVAAEIVRDSITDFETVGGVLTGVGEIISTLDGGADDLGDTYTALLDVREAMGMVGLDGDNLNRALIRAGGGLDDLAGNLGGYFDTYFTDAEQAAALTESLGGKFADLGYALPESRQAFRELVETLGGAGNAAAGAVLGFQGAFDELMSISDQAAEREAERAREIADTRGDLEIELLRAQGDELGAVARERQRELDALREIDPTLATMKERIYQLGDAAKAASAEMGSMRIRSQSQIDSGKKAYIDWMGMTVKAEQFQEDFDAGTLPKNLQNYVDNFWGGKENVPGPTQDGLFNQYVMQKDIGTPDPRPRPEGGGSGAWEEIRRQEKERLDEQRRLHDEQQEALRSLIDTLADLNMSLQEYRESLMQSELSVLSPEAKYAEAKAMFESISRQSMAGDQAALEKLRESADTLLGTSRTYFGSNTMYAADFNSVVDALKAVEGRLGTMQKTAEKGLDIQREGAVQTIEAIARGNSLQDRLLQLREMGAQRDVD